MGTLIALPNTTRLLLPVALVASVAVALAAVGLGAAGVLAALLLVAGLGLGACWFADGVALALLGARVVVPHEAPGLYRVVARLARRAGLPVPRIAIVRSAAPNAFAVGTNPTRAVVGVTTGLLELLDEEELAAVIARELASVRLGATVTSTVAAAVTGALVALGERLQALTFGVPRRDGDSASGRRRSANVATAFAILAGLVIRLAIPRESSMRADAAGASLIGDPRTLAQALDTIESYALGTPLAVTPAASHLFVVAPLTGAPTERLFDVGPSVRWRIERLERLIPRVAPRRPGYGYAHAA